MSHYLKTTPISFLDLLRQILLIASNTETVKLYPIISILSAKGYATLLILLSLPFCTPLQIPGFSVPFGILLSFIGLRMTFLQNVWWPKFILDKTVKSTYVITLVNLTIRLIQYIQKLMHARWLIFTQHPFFKSLNGLIVLVLAIFLSIPFPIPLTNILAAFPILCIGLGQLEDDGLVIVVGYLSAIIGLGSFIALFVFGIEQIKLFF